MASKDIPAMARRPSKAVLKRATGEGGAGIASDHDDARLYTVLKSLVEARQAYYNGGLVTFSSASQLAGTGATALSVTVPKHVSAFSPRPGYSDDNATFDASFAWAVAPLAVGQEFQTYLILSDWGGAWGVDWNTNYFGNVALIGHSAPPSDDHIQAGIVANAFAFDGENAALATWYALARITLQRTANTVLNVLIDNTVRAWSGISVE